MLTQRDKKLYLLYLTFLDVKIIVQLKIGYQECFILINRKNELKFLCFLYFLFQGCLVVYL